MCACACVLEEATCDEKKKKRGYYTDSNTLTNREGNVKQAKNSAQPGWESKLGIKGYYYYFYYYWHNYYRNAAVGISVFRSHVLFLINACTRAAINPGASVWCCGR